MIISRRDGGEEEWRTYNPTFSAATAVEGQQPRKRRLKLASSSSSSLPRLGISVKNEREER